MELFDLIESSDDEVTELFSAIDAIVHCGSYSQSGSPVTPPNAATWT